MGKNKINVYGFLTIDNGAEFTFDLILGVSEIGETSAFIWSQNQTYFRGGELYANVSVADAGDHYAEYFKFPSYQKVGDGIAVAVPTLATNLQYCRELSEDPYIGFKLNALFVNVSVTDTGLSCSHFQRGDRSIVIVLTAIACGIGVILGIFTAFTCLIKNLKMKIWDVE
eukprot:TRINITY_DN922_c0_g1_i3.p1 TRINITY_DN922_c0_g1~~TRINITY_DN922_c0_g1_i3.p1  ORF type:complete len:170 (+),score=23.67 TRINITY_DN922_c0_g1_i3:385-894(+)